jgi:4'-phosphopantetheinyl transferase
VSDAGAARDDVRVFRVDVPSDPAALAPLAAALTDAERAWAARLRDGAPRARFVAARAGLRRLLGARLGCAPSAVPIVADARGKPGLAEGAGAPLSFSVSHSGALALVAIAAQPVGVDVEAMRPLHDAVPLAARFFAPAERDAVARAPADARARRFLELWTAKEAVLKASGAGLAGLPDVALDLGPGSGISGAMHGPGRWQVRTLAPGPGFVAAVAAPWLPARVAVSSVA